MTMRDAHFFQLLDFEIMNKSSLSPPLNKMWPCLVFLAYGVLPQTIFPQSETPITWKKKDIQTSFLEEKHNYNRALLLLIVRFSLISFSRSHSSAAYSSLRTTASSAAD
jgi:hypothetical protein